MCVETKIYLLEMNIKLFETNTNLCVEMNTKLCVETNFHLLETNTDRCEHKVNGVT